MARSKTTAANCPFINGPCLKGSCMIYEPKLKRCAISLLAYNLYRLHDIESQRLERDMQSEEQDDAADQPGISINQNLDGLFLKG